MADEGVSLKIENSFMAIDSWEDYCIECIKNNNLSDFKKKLNQCINYATALEQNELIQYVNRRLGEFYQEDLLDKQKLKKKYHANANNKL